MIVTDEATQRAMARLSTDPDFKMFLQWLEDEKTEVMEHLLTSLSTEFVHQQQGSARVLMDIQRAAMSAPDAVAAMSRNRKT